MKLTDNNWRTMQLVNRAENELIWPEHDQKHYGRAEYWTIASDGYGDCDDYALTKRKELMGEGFPEPALRVAVVVEPNNQRHAVLTVVTDKGDFVLDNLRDAVVDEKDTDYAWIERQDPQHPLGWVRKQTRPVGEVASSSAR